MRFNIKYRNAANNLHNIDFEAKSLKDAQTYAENFTELLGGKVVKVVEIKIKNKK